MLPGMVNHLRIVRRMAIVDKPGLSPLHLQIAAPDCSELSAVLNDAHLGEEVERASAHFSRGRRDVATEHLGRL